MVRPTTLYILYSFIFGYLLRESCIKVSIWVVCGNIYLACAKCMFVSRRRRTQSHKKVSKQSKNGGCNTLKSHFSFLFRISFAVYMRKYFFFISESFLVSNFCLLIIFKFQGCNKENIFIENFRVSSTKTIFP